MMKIKKVLMTILIIGLFIAMVNIPMSTEAAYNADKTMSTIKSGDVIYFDTTGLDDWDNIQIYLWQDGGSYYKSWDNADTMVKVKDNIYSFTAPSDMEADKYNMVIFKNGKSGNENQTIDLGFIEAGFVYKVDNWQDGKRLGYWYLYDNSSIISYLEDVKKYQEDKEYYTEASYGNLDELIVQAATEIEEIRLEAEMDSNGNYTGKYYIQIDYTMGEIDDIVSNLVVDTEILQKNVNLEESNMDEYEQKYTPNSINNLIEKIEEANKLLENDAITIEEMKEAINNIEEAKQALTAKADKTNLEELLKKVQSLDKTIYTEESVNKLSEAAKNSQEIYENDNATQQEVDNSVQALQVAIDSLEKKPIINEESNNQEENNDQNVNNNTEKNEDAENTIEGEDIPKTGDNIMIFAVVLAISVAGLASTGAINKAITKGKHSNK